MEMMKQSIHTGLQDHCNILCCCFENLLSLLFKNCSQGAKYWGIVNGTPCEQFRTLNLKTKDKYGNRFYHFRSIRAFFLLQAFKNIFLALGFQQKVPNLSTSRVFEKPAFLNVP